MKIRLILLSFAVITAFTLHAQEAKKINEYGNIANENASMLLDNYANELMMDPGSTGYIITYGGSKGSSSEAKARADFAKNYLVDSRGVDASRLVIIDGGLKKDPATELWVVPYMALPPSASPTIKPKSIKDKKTN